MAIQAVTDIRCLVTDTNLSLLDNSCLTIDTGIGHDANEVTVTSTERNHLTNMGCAQ